MRTSRIIYLVDALTATAKPRGMQDGIPLLTRNNTTGCQTILQTLGMLSSALNYTDFNAKHGKFSKRNYSKSFEGQQSRSNVTDIYNNFEGSPWHIYTNLHQFLISIFPVLLRGQTDRQTDRQTNTHTYGRCINVTQQLVWSTLSPQFRCISTLF